MQRPDTPTQTHVRTGRFTSRGTDARFEDGSGASAARNLAAADCERRRLERDLHDGAQQQLVSLSLRLRVLRMPLAPGSEAERLLVTAQDELDCSLQQLRELARGLHPAVHSEHGLRSALESLALRAPLPVERVGFVHLVLRADRDLRAAGGGAVPARGREVKPGARGQTMLGRTGAREEQMA